jgi:transposase
MGEVVPESSFVFTERFLATSQMEKLAMCKVIMIGCDLHDKTMLLKIAVGRQAPAMRSVRNTAEDRKKMIADLNARKKQAGAERIVFAYEASGLGFGLYDQLRDAGIECHVLAPTGLERSVQHRRRKTDERDAEQLLGALRAHVLAGNDLPSVWIPSLETRDDRDLVRTRVDMADKLTAVKNETKSLLKRNGIRRPTGLGNGWTRGYLLWLEEISREDDARLAPGASVSLTSKLLQIEFIEAELHRLDEHVFSLAMTDRYRDAFYELITIKGVGHLTAMLFLTEMGDMSRFENRRQIAAFLGLAPSTYESGQADDRKGHITRQGPARVRKILCQATWARVRTDERAKATFDRIVERNPKHKKIAVVACMRRLGIEMWHRASGHPRPDTSLGLDKTGPPRRTFPDARPRRTGEGRATVKARRG